MPLRVAVLLSGEGTSLENLFEQIEAGLPARVEVVIASKPLAGGLEGATVAVEPLLCGRMYAPRGFIEGNAQFTTVRMLGLGTPRSQWLALPIPAFLVHHPSAGPFLVDTGLHPSIASRPAPSSRT